MPVSPRRAFSFRRLPTRVSARLGSGLAGILLTLLSCLLFACGNAAAKSVLRDLPIPEALCLRAALMVLLLLPMIRRRDLRRARRAGSLWLHALRVGCSSLEVCCFFTGITRLPLADVSAIYLASPIYVTAMSALFLGERVDWRRWSAVAVGFAGVVVALHPGGASFGVAALIVVLGSLSYSVSLVATRRLRGAPNFVLVLSQVAGLAVVTSFTLPGWTVPGAGGLAMLALTGMFSLSGYIAMNRGLQIAQASTVAPFNYSSIVWAATLGFLAFGEVPGASVMLGAAIIIGAGLSIALGERRRV